MSAKSVMLAATVVAAMTGTAVAEMTYSEAPMLAALVADGKLPPV